MSDLLIVDDDPGVRAVLRRALGSAGLPARFAVDGRQALALADQRWPAVVLLDLNTPGLDGRATLQEIKQDPALRFLPVVVFTTSSNPRDLAFCYGAGANAYHVKPVRYPEHLQVVRALLGYWLGAVTLPGRERPVT